MRSVLLMLAACSDGGPKTGSVRGDMFETSAEFHDGKSPCMPQAFGSCVVGPACDEEWPQASAGAILINGFGVGFQSGGGGYEHDSIVDGQLFQEGELVMFSASGDEVPAFSGSVVAPMRSQISFPSQTLSRANDFVVQWSPGSNLVGVEVDSENVALKCSFLGANGSGTLPAAALAMMPPGKTIIEVDNANTATVDVDDWQITLVANITSFNPGMTLQ